VVDASQLIAALTARGATVAVAESLTGGLLVAELIRPAGASAVVLGGVVAYNTELKHTLLGVDADLLAAHGPVHPDVAKAMAENVRDRLAVAGRPATIGIATTGVAGPDPQGEQQPGLVFLGLSMGSESRSRRLQLSGSRDDIRTATVVEAVNWIAETLERGLAEIRE
jgi:nicotinamide-nucleotide amidase